MSIKAIIFRFWEHVAVALLAIVVFCFWLFGYPFIPVAREMSVLFLWNCDYLTERLVLPGGMAQYLGECIAQFFLNPVNGALAYAILFILAQKLSSKLLRQFFPNIKDKRQFYPTDYDKECYSLCRVAFDAHTGRLGEQVDTLINTTVTGKSVTWPRPSYDGRYIMYTQTDFGYFSVWHPEADLWLLDLETGETRSIDEVNSKRAESFHNVPRVSTTGVPTAIGSSLPVVATMVSIPVSTSPAWMRMVRPPSLSYYHSTTPSSIIAGCSIRITLQTLPHAPWTSIPVI